EGPEHHGSVAGSHSRDPWTICIGSGGSGCSSSRQSPGRDTGRLKKRRSPTQRPLALDPLHGVSSSIRTAKTPPQHFPEQMPRNKVPTPGAPKKLRNIARVPPSVRDNSRQEEREHINEAANAG